MHETPHAYALAHEGELFVAHAFSQEQAEAALHGADLPMGLQVQDMGERESLIYTHPAGGNREAHVIRSREDALRIGPAQSSDDAE